MQMAKSNLIQPRFVTYIFYGFYLTLTRGISMPVHKHHALQLTLSTNQPFDAWVGKYQYNGRGLLIGSGQSHSTPATDEVLINFLIEPESEAGRHLDQFIGRRSYVSLPDVFVDQFAPLLGGLIVTEQLPREQILDIYHQLIPAVIGATDEVLDLDPRIEESIQRMVALPKKRVSARKLASSVALSESRLLHLFKTETGTTLRAYLLWLRLGQALKLFWTGASLTDAAHAAGFADAAHLSRTSRQVFGAPLSAFSKNDQTLQVYFYEKPYRDEA